MPYETLPLSSTSGWMEMLAVVSDNKHLYRMNDKKLDMREDCIKYMNADMWSINFNTRDRHT
jgi:hypothetical protein